LGDPLIVLHPTATTRPEMSLLIIVRAAWM